MKDIDKFLSSPEALVITGMRRTGKTTILRYYFDLIDDRNKLFIDLENIVNRKYFEEKNYEKIKKNLEFLGLNFFKKAYIVSRSHVPTLYYSDESIIEELFNNQQIVIDNAYALRKSNYSIRIRVSFSSVKLYFPLNLIFNYIVGIWDFDTDWEYGPKLVGIPYAE